MSNSNQPAIMKPFARIQDPRINRTKRHELIDVIFVAICGIICGARSWTEIELIANERIDWFRRFIALPNGIPSHDTLGRIFARIDPVEFRSSFIQWINQVATIVNDVIAIDGKTLRRSFDKGAEKGAIHMVSAWADYANVVLGQIAVDEKSNVITAISQLLKLLEIKGCIVTIDAMGCQKKIAQAIVDAKADYVLAVKGNQQNLENEIDDFVGRHCENDFNDVKHEYYRTQDRAHGRQEMREYYLFTDINWLQCKDAWANVKSVGVVRSVRENRDGRTEEVRSYITTIASGVEVFADAARRHWGIENKLHWCLDVAFREDDCRVRKNNAPQNFAVLRHIALNMLKNENSIKRSLSGKQLTAAMNVKYFEKVLRFEQN